MRDLHVVIVNNIGQMVCRSPVGLQEYGILVSNLSMLHSDACVAAFVLPNTAVDQVVEYGVDVRRLQPNHMSLAIGRSSAGFVARYVRTLSIVVRGQPKGLSLPSKLIQSFDTAEAAIAITRVYQFLRVLTV